jgi:indole-3-glycerol phosphate synthase
MTILDKIVAQKKATLAATKQINTIQHLEQSPLFDRKVQSLTQALRASEHLGIIAEFKRHSPSKGNININADAKLVTTSYVQAGAAALSILTEEHFFKGSIEDLILARTYNSCPILRKDFVIDEYQIIEAKSIGADVILLIAECLTKEQISQLAKTAKSIGLEVLLEVHSEEQLDKLNPNIDVVGVNNRNLKTFKVSLQTSIELFDKIPSDFVKISESGITDPNAIVDLRRKGFYGFLIGEYFMTNEYPGEKLAELIDRTKYIEDLLENAIA